MCKQELMFTGSINVTSNNVNSKITVKRLEKLLFKDYFEDYTKQCGVKITKEWSFDLSPYYEAGLIKSITVKSKFDDNGEASLNGKKISECYISASCFEHTFTSTINISELKAKNNILNVFYEDINAEGCYIKGNGTYTYNEIFINYK